jgi:hypothetical protein
MCTHAVYACQCCMTLTSVPPAVAQTLAGHATRLLPDFSPQNLSNTAWALATLKDCESVRLLHRVRTGDGEAPASCTVVVFVAVKAVVRLQAGRKPTLEHMFSSCRHTCVVAARKAEVGRPD